MSMKQEQIGGRVFSRKEIVKNKEIYNLLKKKDEMIIRLKEMQVEIDRVAKEGTTLGGKIQAVKDKVIPKMEVVVDKLNLVRSSVSGCPTCKWESVDSFLIEDGEVVALIVDRIEVEKIRLWEEFEKEQQGKIGEKDTDNNT